VPLLSPNISAALVEAGLSEKEGAAPDIKKQLERAGLGTAEILEQLSVEMSQAESSSNRLRAIELGLKVHGLMKETAVALPSITIVINDAEAPKGVNPILLPREIQVA
jgi:hypothetical protein